MVPRHRYLDGCDLTAPDSRPSMLAHALTYTTTQGPLSQVCHTRGVKFFSRARRPGDPDDVNRRFNEIVADQGFPSLDPFSFDEAMESAHPINSAEAEAMNPAPIRPRTPTLLAWC